MLPLALFRDRMFTGASLSIVLLSFCSGGLMLALTQYLQFVLGYSPLKAGAALIPLLVAAMAFNGIGVVVDKRLGSRTALAVGLVAMAVGFGLLSLLSPGDGYGMLIAPLVVMGAGSGTAGPAAYGTLLGALPKERAGVGSAVNDTVSQTGQALSIAVLGSVLTAAYAAGMPDGVTGPARHSIGEALAIGDPALASAAKNAFVHAMAVVSLVGVLGGVAAAAVAALMLRPSEKSR
jgi:MFS family permease